jgi:hypothetical protein
MRTLSALDTLERSAMDEHYHMVNIIRTSAPLGSVSLLAQLRLERISQRSFGSLIRRIDSSSYWRSECGQRSGGGAVLYGDSSGCTFYRSGWHGTGLNCRLDILASKSSAARRSSHSRESGKRAPGRLLRTICASLHIPGAADRHRVPLHCAISHRHRHQRA